MELSAGNYLCHSIHLKSHVTLHLGPGATIIAADPPAEGEKRRLRSRRAQRLDALPGLRPLPLAQQPDLGRGPRGRRHHRSRADLRPRPEPRQRPRLAARERGAAARRRRAALPDVLAADGLQPRLANAGIVPGPFKLPERVATRLPDGVGNKAIALKNCRNVLLRDFTILHGGHFAHPRHRRRQPDHRQPGRRHEPRRHRRRRLPQRAHLQLLGELALGRRHLPQVLVRRSARPASPRTSPSPTAS